MTSPKGISASELIDNLEESAVAYGESRYAEHSTRSERENDRQNLTAARKALEEHTNSMRLEYDILKRVAANRAEEVSRLRSQLAAAERDTQRLDAWDSMGREIPVRFQAEPTTNWRWQIDVWRKADDPRPSIREAVDDAMTREIERREKFHEMFPNLPQREKMRAGFPRGEGRYGFNNFRQPCAKCGREKYLHDLRHASGQEPCDGFVAADKALSPESPKMESPPK